MYHLTSPPPCASLRQEGERLVEAEAAVFDSELARRNAADFKWLQQVKRSGTTADRVAAMTLMIRVREAEEDLRGEKGWPEHGCHR